ncbi:protein APCDD1-like [Ptychodera flava]|uniref:protein APCDD1-like n=1 Tax=Ptychodera flava TaxID=63121 RepID=UPI003969E943
MQYALTLVFLLGRLYLGDATPSVTHLSQCNRMLMAVEGNAGVTAPQPPTIYGEWVSTRCEVRPGPEFVTRKYKFHTDGTFTAYQFYYTDNHCTIPAYSLKLRGTIQIGDTSWIIRGATKADYELDRVLITSHRSDITEYLITKVNATCPGYISQHQRWLTHVRYHLFSWYEDKDCLEALSFAMHELQLVRVEVHKTFQPKSRTVTVRNELFLGDVHTDRSQRQRYHPTYYQTPLVNLKEQDNCSICQLIHGANDTKPPSLPALPEYPVILHGEWVSTRCEVRPEVFFLIRHLIFHGNHTWEGNYHHYSDPLCRNPTFSLYAKGYHSEGVKSEVVKGGAEFDFITTEVRITTKDTGTTDLLNAFKGDECGRRGRWEMGVEQDVTQTYGCAALGIRLPHTEYELMKMEYDAKRDTVLLFNGQRPSDGDNPTTTSKRATSYQTPLVQCGGVNMFSQDDSRRQFDQNDSANVAMQTSPSRLLAAVGTLLIFHLVHLC